jgi:3'-phosphoadenosine 5'-phosphosulfate sulfotransferase (PAPS reductase)/FAD synthetase
LEIKVEKTKVRIMEWHTYWGGSVYVSFSGGKDSTVLLDIARQVYPKIPAVFVDTGLEYPEIRQFVKTKDNVTWLRPKMSFKEVIEKYGYPVVSKEQAGWIKDYQIGGTEKRRNRINKVSKKWQYLKDAPFKISDECCNKIKIDPIKKYEKETGRKCILGNLASESNRRIRSYLKFGCNAFDLKRPISTPLGFWTDQDILRYLKEYGIPYSSVYGDIVEKDGEIFTTGEKRTGCMWCMFGSYLDSEPNRFQRMKISHPKQYDYCINKLGLGEVLDYIGVKY